MDLVEWPSESYFERFRNSLLLELKTIDSEIEKVDSPPSQSKFERLRDSLSSVLQSIKLESGHRDGPFTQLRDSLLPELETISEADSPPLQLIIERLLSCPLFLYLEAKWLKRNFGYSPSQLCFLDGLPHRARPNKLYLYFCCSAGGIKYTLFEIELPNPLHYPPTKATQDAEIRNPSPLKPILQLETSKYPDGMCCVQLGLELYFLGGKFTTRTPNVLPQDVYVFNLTLYNKCPHLLRRMNEAMLLQRTPMKSGKASPLAFVADEKIYVIGSNLEDLEDKSLVYFEFYDPCKDQWSVLPNPPIRGRYNWVKNAVVGRKAFLMQEQRRVYCFSLDTHQWTKKIYVFPIFVPLHLRTFTGKIEFVGNSLYGCYRNTVAKVALRHNELRNIAEADEIEEEGEEEDEIQRRARSHFGEERVGFGEEEVEFEQVARSLCNHEYLRMVSKEKGMDAIYNVPRQSQSSTTLLDLGNGYFCYVRTGKPPQIHEDGVDDDDIPSNRNRFISIVIFQTAPSTTYQENIPGFFQAQFVYSKHYTFYSRFGEDVFIKGCYALGLLG